MRLRLSVLLACLACGVTSVAWAQVMTSASGPSLESMSYGLQGISPRNGPVGAKLGESTLLHAALGADIGYDSNVFYEHYSPHGAAVAHVTPALDISNGERDGTAPDGVFYDLGASLTYREYLSGGDEVRKMRAFNPTLGGLLQLSSKQTLSLSLSDNFNRSQDAPYSRPLRSSPTIATLLRSSSRSRRVGADPGLAEVQQRPRSVRDHRVRTGRQHGQRGRCSIFPGAGCPGPRCSCKLPRALSPI